MKKLIVLYKQKEKIIVTEEWGFSKYINKRQKNVIKQPNIYTTAIIEVKGIKAFIKCLCKKAKCY